VSAWAIYDVFDTADGEQVFVGVVSDGQWQTFTRAFDLGEIGRNPAYAENNARVAAREVIMPAVRGLFKSLGKAELVARLETLGLPFAPITRPEDLFDDPHLNAQGGLVEVTLPDNGVKVALPALPLAFDGRRPGLSRDLAAPGADTEAVLGELER
jgi:crotonobetainyl-CoA:carnitine CoA-transferase CaiB-like acyl-CoA transferase